MDSLVTLLASRTAATALGLGRQTVAAAAKPFDAVLDAAMGASSESSDAAVEVESQHEGHLQQLVCERLQQLLESLGVTPGERFELEIDQSSGEVRVAGNHLQATELEDVLRQDPQLCEDLRQLAAASELFRDGFSTRTELTVQTGADGDAALIEWRPFG